MFAKTIHPMSKILVEEKIKALKKELSSIGSELLNLADRFDVNKENKEIIAHLLSQIQENFMFVIVGEVNAGKSSFVNSLLGAEICATGKEIVTREVQKVVYGQTDRILKEDEFLVRKELPVEILKEITIVDTPGTNSRELSHQLITETFVPNSNLIIFVFQIDNIHVQSAWDFFRKIKEKWSKKILFVLTKADTQPSAKDIEDYKNILLRYTHEEKMDNAQIFVTSAQKEKQGDAQGSGFATIREYINTHITGKAAQEKIKDDFHTVGVIFKNIQKDFQLRIDNYQKDRRTRDEINRTLLIKEQEATQSVDELLHRFVHAYEKATKEALDKLAANIGMWSMTWRSLGALFGGKSTRDWLDQLKADLQKSLENDFKLIMQSGLDTIKNNIQLMAIGIRDQLEQIQTPVKGPKNMFDHIETKRIQIIHKLKDDFSDFTERSAAFKGENLFHDKIDYSQNIFAGGGIAVIGAIIAAVTNTAALDITGGVVTALGLIVAGVTITVKKRKIMKDAENTILENRKKIEETMGNWLRSYIREIQNHINENFLEMDNYLGNEKYQIEEFESRSVKMKNFLLDFEGKIV